MKLRVRLLFPVLLLFTTPCCATRPLCEIVLTDLYNNFAIPIRSEELSRKIRRISNDYEAKIVENLQRLSVASMEDLLAFLRKDALSLEEILTKIDTGGYQNKHREDVFCFHHLSRWSFDKIQGELAEPTDTSEKNFRHLSETTVKVFLEAELLFQEYVRACGEIFNITDEIGEILNKSIRSLYNLKKSEMLYNELYGDPWYLAARASDGDWSTVLYSILEPPKEASQTEEPPPRKFNSAKTENFINSVTKNFNKCVDASKTDDTLLKQSIKRQFRANCVEYLLRGVYAYYKISSPERNTLVKAIFECALKTPDPFEP